MSAARNPPKWKTLARHGRQVDFAAGREAMGALTDSEFKVLNLLQSLAEGWRTSIEWMADTVHKSKDSIWRALSKLKSKGYLAESAAGVLTVSWRPMTQPQTCGSTRATNEPKKKNPDASARPTDKQQTNNRRPNPTPTKAPSMYTADAKDRPTMDWEHPDRMAFEEYQQHWMAITGKMKVGLKPRDLHALEHWTAAEMRDAFQATAKANHPGWRYFAAVLERIADGKTEAPKTTRPHDHPTEGRLADYREHKTDDEPTASKSLLAELKKGFFGGTE